MNVGKSLRVTMAERNLNQQQVAKSVGVSRTYISAICRERAKVSQDVLERLAEAVGYSVSEFIKRGE